MQHLQASKAIRNLLTLSYQARSFIYKKIFNNQLLVLFNLISYTPLNLYNKYYLDSTLVNV